MGGAQASALVGVGRGGGVPPLLRHPSNPLPRPPHPPPGAETEFSLQQALGCLFCSRKLSFIRVLLLVLFICIFFFLISKIKERFIKWGGGGGEEGDGQGGSDPSMS